MSGNPSSKNAVGATGQSSTWNRVRSLASWACQYLAGPCPSCRASRLAASGEELLGQGFCHRGREGGTLGKRELIADVGNALPASASAMWLCPLSRVDTS